jgi:energy-coupling factor transporter ATP-binding protein EcfA2
MDNTGAFPKRILLLGKSGSGKSTLGKTLSALLNIEHIEMDRIFWKPNWVKKPQDEMRVEVDERVRADGEWIVDGNYRFLADITWQRAELIIWLDYPILVVLWRLILRSLWRIWTGAKVCGDNYESGAALFWPTREYNILLCCIGEMEKHNNDYPKYMKEYGAADKIIIFKQQAELDGWLEKVQRELEMKSKKQE